MKTMKLFLMGLIAFGLGFTACNTDDHDMPKIDKGKAEVSIRVAMNNQGTRTVGDITSDAVLDDESRINSLEIWIFSGSSRLVEAHRRVLTSSAKEYGVHALDQGAEPDPLQKFGNAFVINGITVPAGAKYLVMAANTNVGEVANLDLLKAELSAVASQDIKDGLAMTSLVTPITLLGGVENMFGAPPKGHHHYDDDSVNQLSPGAKGLEPPLWLSRINARVALASLEFEFPKAVTDPVDLKDIGGLAYHGLTGAMRIDGKFIPFDRFVLTDVVMLNAPKRSKMFAAAGERLFAQNEFFYGADLPPFGDNQFKKDDPIANATFAAQPEPLVNVLANADQRDLTVTGMSVGALLLERTNTPYFYVLENDFIPGERMMMVIKGELWNGDTRLSATDLPDNICKDGFTYYTIFVGKDYARGKGDDGKVVFDNTVYRNTQYNFSVILAGAGYHRVGDETAKLDVLCDVEPWRVAEQDIKF